MRRLALPLLALALLAGSPSSAPAAFGYAYAEQTLSSLRVTTAVVGGTVTGTSTSASAATNGAGVSTNGSLDALQAYQGVNPPPSQNSFTTYSTQGGGPQAGDFTRGDVLISGTGGNLFNPTGVSASNVAESALSASGLVTASGSWAISGTFSTSAVSVTVGYNYANDILALVDGQGQASASFGLIISIKDLHGHEVDASPAELNTALSAPPNSPELISSGSGSATLSLAGLTAGDTYTISITGTELTAVSAVPEPSSLALCGLAAAAGLGLHGLRRERSR